MAQKEDKLFKEIEEKTTELDETLSRVETKSLRLQKTLLGDTSEIDKQKIPEELKGGLLQRVKYSLIQSNQEALRIESLVDETLAEFEELEKV